MPYIARRRLWGLSLMVVSMCDLLAFYTGADLRGVNMQGAHVYGCDFSSSYLHGAIFRQALVSGCKFEQVTARACADEYPQHAANTIIKCYSCCDLVIAVPAVIFCRCTCALLEW